MFNLCKSKVSNSIMNIIIKLIRFSFCYLLKTSFYRNENYDNLVWIRFNALQKMLEKKYQPQFLNLIRVQL